MPNALFLSFLALYRWSISSIVNEDFDGKPVLVYCTVGCRSAGQAQILQEQGVEVYNLWGGVIDWAFHQWRVYNLVRRAHA